MQSPNTATACARPTRITAAAVAMICMPLAAFAQLHASMSAPMSAPTVTVGQVLRLQQQDTTKAPQPKVERPKATASLDAIYGNEQALRFDISLMDQKSTGLKIGDLARWAASSCKIESYQASNRCVTFSQGSGPAICPRQACWPGVPMPVTPAIGATPTLVPTGSGQAVFVPAISGSAGPGTALPIALGAQPLGTAPSTHQATQAAQTSGGGRP